MFYKYALELDEYCIFSVISVSDVERTFNMTDKILYDVVITWKLWINIFIFVFDKNIYLYIGNKVIVITLANNCKLTIFFGVIFIIYWLALSILIANIKNFLIFKPIPVQLLLYIPCETASFYGYKLNRQVLYSLIFCHYLLMFTFYTLMFMISIE